MHTNNIALKISTEKKELPSLENLEFHLFAMAYTYLKLYKNKNSWMLNFKINKP